MREIKFRVWFIETKQFFYWNISEGCPGCLTKKYIKECSQEFTGLKDKNGKEIYEGDILKGNQRIAKVVFEDACFLVQYSNRDSNFIAPHNYFEVIGNTYENQELLKEKA